MKRRGLTLVEVMIALGALALITLAIYALLHAGSSTYANASRRDTLQMNARRVLDQIAEELRLANPDSFILSSGSILFNKAVGFSGGTTSYGSTIEYALRAYTDPKAHFVDANHNGVPDEACLERTQDGETRKLCDYVKLGGFTAVKTGQTVNLRLTLIVADDKHTIVETSVSTSIVMRNPGGS